MKNKYPTLSLLAALWMALPAAAGPETLERCPPAAKPWLPAGASQNVCSQFSSNAGVGATNYGGSYKMAAFSKDGKLAGLRNPDLGREDPAPKDTYDPAAWEQSGSTGPVGELWWGRRDNMHLFVGQESKVRLTVEASHGPMPGPAERQARMLAIVAQAQAMAANKPIPQSAYDNLLFIHRSMEYRQIDGTDATFRGGLGGDGFIPPGKISDAKLKLDNLPAYKGVLSFEMKVDGVARRFSFPVMLDQPTDHLIAAAVNGDSYVKCEKRPNRGKNESLSCPLNKENFPERYDAEGAFFGDHATLAAVKIYMTVNSPARNRHEDIATAVIILRAEASPPVAAGR
ncbi:MULTISPECIES: hypothetical protein [unclassified Duganella]|uniref:hypothetical protein n=1 Tax=unclassified Duganella TaxID=2636909 RepID=UPI000E348A7F|nr:MULTISPECIES: hypothetical protein [unclassified Duganella]RFP19068.1 hypothetical protein D0T23_04600 [Duganella sp. BJB475]RFP35730.1 hypothetical protein D0T21_04600 [Duganella sp. BJB476]